MHTENQEDLQQDLVMGSISTPLKSSSFSGKHFKLVLHTSPGVFVSSIMKMHNSMYEFYTAYCNIDNY